MKTSHAAPPPVLQLAFNGAWEDALVLPVGPDSREAALAWLADAQAVGEGAVEIVYRRGEQRVLLGVRVRGTEMERLRMFLATVVDRPGRLDWSSAVAHFRNHFGGDAFEARGVAALDLGVFNAWRLHPVFRLWSSGGSEPEPSQLAHAAMECDGWGTSVAAPLLLEATWSSPIEHWGGVTISRVQDRRSVVDPEMVEHAVTLLWNGMGSP